MVTLLPRSEWDAVPARGGPGALTPSRVLGTVIHWPGMRSPIDASGDAGKRRVASALRGWQSYHMAPEPGGRGWSDIAYQAAVDQAGRAWNLRGLTTQSGANGNAELNEEYGAILLVLGPGEEPSAAMISTVRDVIAQFRKYYPRALAIRPHSAVRPDGTDCPGDRARAAIARGAFAPGTTEPEEDEMTPAQMQALENFIEGRLKAYTESGNTFTRQTVAAHAKEIIAADASTDKAEADRIIDAITAQEEARSAQLLAAVKLPVPGEVS